MIFTAQVHRTCVQFCVSQEIIQCTDLPALQKTPASSAGTQSWTPNPLRRHWVRFASFPLQLTLSITITPAPGPKWGDCVAVAPGIEICNKTKNSHVSKHTYYGSNAQTSFFLNMELTDCTIAQLSAHNCCIIVVPRNITHCTPHSPVAELYTAVVLWYTTNQSNCSINTFWTPLKHTTNSTNNIMIWYSIWQCLEQNERTFTSLWTDHSGILTIKAVVDTKSIVRAIHKVCLIPSAAHIIQEDISSSMTKDTATNNDWYCI